MKKSLALGLATAMTMAKNIESHDTTDRSNGPCSSLLRACVRW